MTLPLGVPIPAALAGMEILGAMSTVLTAGYQALNIEAVRLAMQGPLAPYFAGLQYNASTDSFTVTTDQQLTPMYEAIFKAAPSDATGATQWLQNWTPIIDTVLADLARGQGLQVTYAYEFDSMVRAYETVGLPLDIKAAAAALGVPSNLVQDGAATLAGDGDADLFYMSSGDQTAVNTRGQANFIFGGNFGHDVVDNDQAPGGLQSPTMAWFATVKSTDVSASRDGNDLILTVDSTGQSVRFVGEFVGYRPAFLTGQNLNPSEGVKQIVFADGVVWDSLAIANAVVPSEFGQSTVIYTGGAMSVLDTGASGGTHYLSGGDGDNIYRFGVGYGQVTIEGGRTDVLLNSVSTLEFGAGITAGDLSFSRIGNTGDLVIRIKGTSDSLTITEQFTTTQTGVFGLQWFDRIENFVFADGSMLSWQDIQNNLIAQEAATPGAAIYGYDTDDVLDPGLGGGHLISGGTGNDTYVFGMGYGTDTISVGSTNIDDGMNRTMVFNPDTSPSQVTFSRPAGTDDLVVTLSDGSQVDIQGEFTATDTGPFGVVYFNQIQTFQFQDANSTTLTVGQIEQMLIAEGDAGTNNTVAGFNDVAVTFDGGTGSHVFMGTSGGDTYVFGHGYGHDTIIANHSTDLLANSNNDVLLMKPDVDPSQVTLSRAPNGNDLTLTLDDGSTVVVQGEFLDTSGFFFN